MTIAPAYGLDLRFVGILEEFEGEIHVVAIIHLEANAQDARAVHFDGQLEHPASLDRHAAGRESDLVLGPVHGEQTQPA